MPISNVQHHSTIAWQIAVVDSVGFVESAQHTSGRPGTLMACSLPTDLISGIQPEILLPLLWHLIETNSISTRNYATAIPWKQVEDQGKQSNQQHAHVTRENDDLW